MRIGELSRRTGIPSHRLRYYDDHGLLPGRRTPNGYRDFAPEAELRAAQVARLVGMGLTMEDVQVVLPCTYGPEVEVRLCESQRRQVAERLALVQQRLAGLERSAGALQEVLARDDADAAATH